MLRIWSLVFGSTIFQILPPYLDFEGAKNIHVLKVLIWGFEGHWRFLTGVWHLYLDLDMVTGFGIPMFQVLAPFLDFEGVNAIHVL